MIKLNLQREPYWMNLSASVRLFVRPLSTAIMHAAQHSVIKETAALKEKKDATFDIKCYEENRGFFESLLIKAVARYAIIKWEGIFESDADQLAAITDNNVNNLMDIWFVSQEFWAQYTKPMEMLVQEGKSSELVQSGTLEAGSNTVVDAKKKGCRAAKGKRAR